MAGRLTLMEELKLKQKRTASYKNDAKNEEESTPIKHSPTTKKLNTSTNKPNTNNANNTPKLAQNPATKAVLSQHLARRKPNPKPSKAHKTSLSNIVGSTDHMTLDIKDTIFENKKNINDKDTIFDEEEKYDELLKNEDTMSIYTDSTYISTTASLQSFNGRKKKKKKKKKKAHIIHQGSHITSNKPRKTSVSRSSDIPPITYSQHTPPNSPPLSLSQRNLDQHNKIILRKRKHTGLSIINTIGDGIPDFNKIYPQNISSQPEEKVSVEIVPAKARHSFEAEVGGIHGFDDGQGSSSSGSIKPGVYDLSVKGQLYTTNIFAFLCSIDLMINIPTLYKACDGFDNSFIWILVIYVIFQMISSLIISCFMNYERNKWILVILCTFLFFGNLLYTHSISVGDSIFLLLVGRAMCGISGSILVVGYSIITLCSNILNRESLIVIFRFITSIGMVIGPLIGLLLSLKQFNIAQLWTITDTNAGSFIMSCLSAAYLCLFVIYLAYNYFVTSKKKKEKMDGNSIQAIHAKQAQKYTINNMENDKHFVRTSSDEIIQRQQYSDKYNAAILSSKKRKNHSLFRNKYVLLLLFLYISCLFTFWSFSAVIVPIGAYNDNNYDNNIATKYNQTVVYGIFAVIGIFFILSFFINRLLNYKIFTSISFDKRVIVAIQLQCIGYFLLTTFGIYNSESSPYSIPLTQLILATFFICIGFGIATLQIPAIFCLITGTKLKNIGIRMSWFFIVSSVGRIIGPIFGYYVIKAQAGSIDVLAHLSAFYLLIISFIALIIIMEANKKTAFFPAGYHKNVRVKSGNEGHNVNIGTLHSQRKSQRVHSASMTQSLTPYSRAKLHAQVVDESATKTCTNSKSKSKSKSKSGEITETKEESDHDEYLGDNKDKKKLFHYSPVNLTESAESIKVTYKPKKTFLEKWENENEHGGSLHKNDSKQNLLSKIKETSSRLLGKSNKDKQKTSVTNVQAAVLDSDILQL